MADYQHHPEPTYGIELRYSGWTSDDYIAQARGFRSTDEFLEYRDATPERKAEIRSNRGNNTSATDDGDLMRYAAYLNLKAK